MPDNEIIAALKFDPSEYSLYIGCSQWTSANRNHAVHIASQISRLPFCKRGNYLGNVLDRPAFDWKQVTCQKCRRKFLKYWSEEQIHAG
jgi:hypothetical protein